MPRRLLVTGANGFTGSHLAQAASSQGFSVHCLVANLNDIEAIESEVQSNSPAYVIHLAAISAVTHDNLSDIYKVNLFGTLNLLTALSKLPITPTKVILASSANIYGNVQCSPIEETTCPAPVNHYAISKLSMEYMAATYFDKLPIILTRPFNYTGLKHDERFVIPKIVRHFAQRLPNIELGNLQVEREFNDVRTVCAIYIKLLRYGKIGETYNICSGKAIKLQFVIDTLSNLTNHNPLITINPNFVRPNEVFRLSGSTTKLEDCIGSLNHINLEETLTWMLSQYE